MTYRHDVFISYRRQEQWTPWARKHVKPLMESYLQQELGAPADIFVDEQIEPGADWPNRLGDALARSRILVPLFSGDYFGSEFCLHELDLMHGRLAGHAEATLIVPILVHDGDLIPVELRRKWFADFKDFRNPYLCKGTPLYQDFGQAMKELAPIIASAIRSAPSYDPAWDALCRARFDKVYRAQNACTQEPLTTLTRKPLPTPTIVPRASL